jgi:hypothetical protein
MVRASWTAAVPLVVLLMVGQSIARPQQPTATVAVAPSAPARDIFPSASTVNIAGIGMMPVINSTAANANSTGNGTSTSKDKKKTGMPESPFGFSPFIYLPGFAVAVFGAVAFGISGFVSTYQYFTIKAWYFLLPWQAGLAAFAGMAARLHAVLHRDPNNMTSFIVQMTMSSMQPTLMSIATIMTFTRVIWWMTPLECMNRKLLGLPHHWISFIWAGILTTQDITKALAANFGKPKEGEHPNPAAATYRIQQIALCLQFFIMLAWTIWAVLIMKMAKRWTRLDDEEDLKARVFGWVCVAVGGIMTVSTVYI